MGYQPPQNSDFPPYGGYQQQPPQQPHTGYPPQQPYGGFEQPGYQQQPAGYGQQQMGYPPQQMGYQQPPMGYPPMVEGKRMVTAALLCFFLGTLGIHRFYTGHTALGIIQLLTLGGCGIWALVDFIMILTGSYTDANGFPLIRT